MLHDFAKPPRFLGLKLNRQDVIRALFMGKAGIAIVVLFLIMIFLLREGAGFLGTYRWELGVYRQAGLELCDEGKKPLAQNAALHGKLKRALAAEIGVLSGKERARRDAALLVKSSLEDLTQLPTEALAAALKAKAPAEQIEPLRTALRAAQEKALGSVAMPAILSANEQQTLRSQLAVMMPDDVELPALIRELSAAFATQDAVARKQYRAFIDAVDAFEEAAEPLAEVHDNMEVIAKETKAAAVNQHMAEDARTKLTEAANLAKTEADRSSFTQQAAAMQVEPIDYAARIAPLLALVPEYDKLMAAYLAAVGSTAAALPATVGTAEAKALLREYRAALPDHLATAEQSDARMKAWDGSKPVPLMQAATSFLFGGDWITNSSWQDFYGVLPLLTGSLLIALVAVVIALPLSVAAAIYTNQLARPWEQEIIKPGIEFIQAIPSIVFGFIGISVFGDLLRELSLVSWLSWVPGFPMQERLNIFNAGCLLALMAIPTMFSLAEDALNNVPRAFSEASAALGASHMQTLFRITVPASLSGIFAALLLGLGRIMGETMVVLLVAGNRIAIPNFSDGPGVVFQPAHTLTGIIAQELGEVSRGSAHWQALFMVGILLFMISLAINYTAQRVVKRFALPKI